MKINYVFILLAFLVILFVVLVVVVIPQFTPKQPVENDTSHLYYKDNFGVYIYQQRESSFIGNIGPDLRLFRYQKISQADPNTFQILLSDDNTATILARDRNYVYYGGELVASGDVNTLQVLNGFAKDHKNIYLRGLTINSLDTETFELLGGNFIKDRNGLYAANSSQPRKLNLVDAESFRLTSPRYENGIDYIAEDRNFDYYSAGGTYLVTPKPHVENFKQLGCHYYQFKEKIFYSVYQLAEADPATFRVLDVLLTDSSSNINRCYQFYAVDKNYRWNFENRVKPNDEYDNHQIDVLLASPEDKKRLSKHVSSFVCIPKDNYGINYGYSDGEANSRQPGSIRIKQYMDARILDAELLNAKGEWQQLPSTSEITGLTCMDIYTNKFSNNDIQPWFERRNSQSHSFTISQWGSNPIFVAAEDDYTVRFAFAYQSIARMLDNELKNSRVELHDAGVTGRGVFENRLFLNTENLPEIWIRLQIKNAPLIEKEGTSFINVGFVYQNGFLQCLNGSQCATFGIPNSLLLDH